MLDLKQAFLVCSLVSTLASTPALAADTTVFGLKLGDELNVPRCPTGAEFPSTLCLEGVSTGTTLKLRFPGSPEYVWRRLLYADLIDNKIEGISFLTNGLPYQKRVLDALTQKYGKPTKSGTLKMQNGYGAKIDVIQANWTFKEFTVQFIGAVDADMGSVGIVSPKLAAARKAEKERQQQSTPRL